MNTPSEDLSIERKTRYRVPFGTISVTEEARRLIDAALENRMLTRGKYVAEFERRFAALFGARGAVAVSSGTDADALALAVLYDDGARRGDEVIVPALSFIATGNAVFQAGFRPVFVDVRRETLNIDPEKIEEAITPRTRAILPVHLMGKPAPMDPIMEIAHRRGLRVIEDAAEAHGARYRGTLVGRIGDMAAFSLYAAHIVTSIEGGMVITDDPRMAEALRSLRNHGIVGKFEFRRIGFSAKMNEIEAAVGLGNIRIFDRILERRRRNLLYLSERFRRFDEWLLTTREEEGETIGPHAFAVVLREGVPFTRDEMVDHLDAAGIDSRNLFASIPTQCPSYAFLGYRPGDFPEAEYCGDHGFHIGIHQDLDEGHLDHVVETVARFLAAKGIPV